jgi:hypothetical protein
MTTDIVGTPNPDTDKLVLFAGVWFWPCPKWLELESEFGEDVLLTVAGNANYLATPAKQDSLRLRRGCIKYCRSLERV